MANRHGPCMEKKCSWCCDPVKVPANFSDEKIPLDKEGKRIWRDREEIVVPESQMETVRLKTFDCDLLDTQTGKCSDYENRPEICRNTSCVDEKSTKSVDEQHRETLEEELIPLKGKK
ncbi:YkgJ family cysteine cluster protein [Candidatus Uhrbacteria bacterium]|nr:YkgJ family cysteine cluster protein [Candidatus Uhrbacteria bacterium]